MIATYGGTGRFLTNLGVAVAGSGMLLAVGAVSRSRGAHPAPFRAGWLAGVAIAAVAATLVLPGIDGVHRWIGTGGVQLHASLLLSPWILVIAHRFVLDSRWRIATVGILALQTVHLLQPDAAQATAVAVAVAALSLSRAVPLAPHRNAIFAASAIVPGIAVWFRADPLAGVVDVERVVETAFSQHLLLGLAAVLSVCVLALPFALHSHRRAKGPVLETPSAVVGVYVVAVLVSTALGEFPVLVLGYGVSTVLGYYSAATASLVLSPRTGPDPTGTRPPPTEPHAIHRAT